ncbi:lysophospholipid acyltransferase family protein [Pseudoalteromonas denitrificans]|uniref:1-acyl-sn-glycerol-3-phosphate acyltransferases n=1 Tax=Pseudoalteromonas denitrificans DSM 6059 TaxID=1123010 RepID=A0A1I1I3P3_9GAMM|nr:lysophospholipid acyltransferase family protein [Pseudoalteromonas denitrificans]SFC30655.1 1-acyl-sn-glycerol-3-phosphate acyltransferases [Pseudoalteromonas denitrificans DSM 6059]
MFKKINYIWRLFATVFCFLCFGIGGLFLSAVVFPLQSIVLKNTDKRKVIARKTVHYSFKFFVLLMQFLRVIDINISKISKIKNIHGQLLLANHPSLIDVVVLISIIPNADCVVKAHLFKNPFIRGVVKNTGYISNEDPEGLLADCKNTLDAGNNLIIFPEGTRTNPDNKIEFKRGAANIALRCKASITAVIIKVAPSTLTKSLPWYRIPSEKVHFTAKLVYNIPDLPEYDKSQTSKYVRQYSRDLENYFKEELIINE